MSEKTINTRRLQIFSLFTYMLNEHSALFDGVCFTSPDTGKHFTFSQAVDAFNNRSYRDEDIIEYVKLRYSKKKKAIICTNNFVKFTQVFKDSCEEHGADLVASLESFLKKARLR